MTNKKIVNRASKNNKKQKSKKKTYSKIVKSYFIKYKKVKNSLEKNI